AEIRYDQETAQDRTGEWTGDKSAARISWNLNTEQKNGDKCRRLPCHPRSRYCRQRDQYAHGQFQSVVTISQCLRQSDQSAILEGPSGYGATIPKYLCDPVGVAPTEEGPRHQSSP